MGNILLASAAPRTLGQLAGLVQAHGHRCHTAENLDELEDVLGRHTISAVVLDLQLADLEGPGLVSLVRRRCPSAPIVAVTESYAPELELRLRAQGIVHLATKPVSPELLAGVVIRCVERSRAAP